MKISKITFVSALALITFSSCQKGSSSASSALQYQLQTVNHTGTVNRIDATGTVQWTTGFANADLIKLEANNNNSEVEFKSKNQQHIDLFASIASSLGNITIPPGNYSEVEFKIELNPSGSQPSVELNGQYNNGTTTIPVTFRANSMLEIKAEQNNVTITDNTTATALTTLDLSLLTTGITQAMLNSATLTGGTIMITSSSNTNLYSIIVANLNNSHEVEVHH